MLRVILMSVLLLSAAPGWANEWADGWEGFYFGIGRGHGQGEDKTGKVLGETAVRSVFAGYLFDVGGTVLGGEVARSWASFPVFGAAQTDYLTDARAIFGEQLGSTLFYLTGGYSHARSPIRGSDGYVAGAGIEQLIGQRLSVGALGLFRAYDDGGANGRDRNYWSLVGRVSIRF